jgi:uncharacterized tellurite resistance protein B-like protein
MAMNRLSTETRRAYLANVIAIARADGEPGAGEARVLEAVAERVGATPSDVAEARKMTETEIYRFAVMADPPLRLANFEDMLMVGMADGRINAAESVPLDKLAKVLNFSKLDVNMALQRAKGRLARATPPAVARPSLAPPPVPSRATVPSVPARRTVPPPLAADAAPDDERAARKLRWKNVPQRRAALKPREPTPMITVPWQVAAAAPPSPAQAERSSDAYELAEDIEEIEDRQAAGESAAEPTEETAETAQVQSSIRDLCMRAREASSHPDGYCYGTACGETNVWGCRLAEMPLTPGADWLVHGRFRDERAFVFDRDAIGALLEERLAIAAGCPYLRLQQAERSLAAFPLRAVPGRHWKYRPASSRNEGLPVSWREYVHGCPVTRHVRAVCMDPVDDGAARKILRDSRK